MTITSAKYMLGKTVNKSVTATIDGQVLYVPMDTNNRHYQAILEWVDEGNTIEEAD
jgi:hypothetical protein